MHAGQGNAGQGTEILNGKTVEDYIYCLTKIALQVRNPMYHDILANVTNWINGLLLSNGLITRA